MKVTKVWARAYESGKLVGFAKVELDGIMTLDGFKVFKGRNNELYIREPSNKDPKGKKDEQGNDVYYKTVSIDGSNEAGKKLLDEITREVIYALKNEKPKTQTQSSKAPSQDEDPDVPF